MVADLDCEISEANECTLMMRLDRLEEWIGKPENMEGLRKVF